MPTGLGEQQAEPCCGLGCLPRVGFQVDVEGLAVGGLGLGEPPLLLGDAAFNQLTEAKVPQNLQPSLNSGLDSAQDL